MNFASLFELDACGTKQSMAVKKTTWIAGEGRMTFILPNRTQHEVPATCVDRPDTLCSLVDAAGALSPLERDILVALIERSKR